MKGVLILIFTLMLTVHATAQVACEVTATDIPDTYAFTARVGKLDKLIVYRDELIRAAVLTIPCKIKKDSTRTLLKPIIQGYTMQVIRGDQIVNTTYANTPYWSGAVQQYIQIAQDGDTVRFKDITFGLSPCPYDRPRSFKAQQIDYIIKYYVDESEPVADMDPADKKKGS